MLMEEEQKDLESFSLASPSVSIQKGKKGKDPLWKVSQENTIFFLRLSRHNSKLIRLVLIRCSLLDLRLRPWLLRFRFRPKLSSSSNTSSNSISASSSLTTSSSSAQHRAALDVLVRQGVLNPFAEVLQDEASLRGQARSEVLYRVTEFCQLERANAVEKKGIMGMRLSQISSSRTRLDRRLHINCLELKAVISALHHWVSVIQGCQVLITTDNTTVISYQQTRRDPLSILVTSSSGFVYVTASSEPGTSHAV